MDIQNYLDKLENKIAKYEEENFDEEDIPPWIGNKTDTDSSTSTDSDGLDSFDLQEGEEEIIIRIGLPGVSEEEIEVTLDKDSDKILVSVDSSSLGNRDYEYQLPSDADTGTVNPNYESGLLVIRVERN